MKTPNPNTIVIKISIFILLLTTFFLEIEISNVDKNSFLTMMAGSLISLIIRFFIKPFLVKKLFEKDLPSPPPDAEEAKKIEAKNRKDESSLE